MAIPMKTATRRRAVITTVSEITTINSMAAASGMLAASPMRMTTNRRQLPLSRGSMTEAESAALYRLMTWLSPAFPVGGFSYSSGIEWAVEAGDINDAATLNNW